MAGVGGGDVGSAGVGDLGAAKADGQRPPAAGGDKFDQPLQVFSGERLAIDRSHQRGDITTFPPGKDGCTWQQ
jgi:hypothetical protein